MKKIGEKILSWAISGVFLAGLYSIGHFVLKMNDTAFLILTGWLIWAHMAETINKSDAPASK